jgi:aminopeptidase N
MVNDGDFDDYNATLYVTAHEIGHSYFPFNTGLNEQSSAWMDEGMITFLPRIFVNDNTKDSNYVVFKDIIDIYNKRAGSSFEIPLMIPSTNTGFAYRYHAYNRSSVAFLTLYNYLGEEKFTSALKEFAKVWEHKHPYPYDFFFTFNKVAGEDLSWFWKPWFYEMGYADLSIGKIENNKVQILNKGGFPVGVNLTIKTKDGNTNITRKANVWKNGISEIWIDLPKGKITQIELDTKTTPDVFPKDNILRI